MILKNNFEFKIRKNTLRIYPVSRDLTNIYETDTESTQTQKN